MSRLKIGTTVKYAQPFSKGVGLHGSDTLVGQVDRVIASSPSLIYVRWNDGSYNAVSENHLESF